MKRKLVVKNGNYKGTHEATIYNRKEDIAAAFSILGPGGVSKAVLAVSKSGKLKLAANEKRLPDTIYIS